MGLATSISVAESLLKLGQEIAILVKKAQESPDVTKRVLLYLEAARAAVNALGLERQRILTDVRRCDVSDPAQVNALWTRLDRYLHEDNIRPQLQSSINGLAVCHGEIRTKATAAWWRKRNKEAAVETFSNTLYELESVLRTLTSNFYPGGSGMGVQTLVPLFELVTQLRDDLRHGPPQPAKLESMDEQLGDLASHALRDSSHEDWFRTAGNVEALIAELQLAFSVKVLAAAGSGS